MKKKAMVLAAGMGTRLRDLTRNKPKALVEYKGKTLLEIVLRRLIHHGFRDIIINVHHFPEQIIDFVESKRNFGIDIRFSDEAQRLLDTGGGIRKASWFFGDDHVLIHNVDVYTDLNLDELYNLHVSSGNLATLAVKDRTTTRPFLVDHDQLLCGWENLLTGEKIISRNGKDLERIAYSGIAVFSPDFIQMLPQIDVFPLVPELLRISGANEIKLFPHSGVWKDMGKPEEYIVL
jgi:NDP-sugar pyrophosphorylase family protein